MVENEYPGLSLKRQCILLSVQRSGLYLTACPAGMISQNQLIEVPMWCSPRVSLLCLALLAFPVVMVVNYYLFWPVFMVLFPLLILFDVAMARDGFSGLNFSRSRLILLALLLVYLLISALISPNPLEAIAGRWSKLAVLFAVVFFLLSWLANSGFYDSWVIRFSGFFGFVLGLTLLASKVIFYDRSIAVERLSYYNVGLMFLVIVLWPVLSFYAWSKISKPLILFMVLAVGYVLISSSSQASTLALMCSFIAYILFSSSNSPKWLVQSSFLFFFVFIALFPFLLLSLAPVLVESFGDSAIYQAGAGESRISLYLSLARSIRYAPVLGYGLYSTPTVFHVLHPHNMSLQIWLEFGLLGLLIFSFCAYCVYLAVVSVGVKCRPYVMASIVAYLTIAMVDNDLFKNFFVASVAYSLVLFRLSLFRRVPYC